MRLANLLENRHTVFIDVPDAACGVAQDRSGLDIALRRKRRNRLYCFEEKRSPCLSTVHLLLHLCGGWAALFGYLLGVGLLSSGNETKDKEKPTEAKQAKEGQAKEAARTAASKTEDEPVNPPLRAGVMGLFLGMLVALALSLVDSIWILGTNQPALIAGRASASRWPSVRWAASWGDSSAKCC